MGDLQRAFITTAGATWKYTVGSDGNDYYFRDGTPKKQEAFNSATQHVRYDGQEAKVAVPSKTGGPGYKRIEVNPIEASELGKQLRLVRNDVHGQPSETVMLNGKEYKTKELADLNERIYNNYGTGSVMKYT